LALKLITPISTEPITRAQVKQHLRLDINDNGEDNQIDTWIAAARTYGEGYTNRAFGTQTWELSLDNFPCRGYIELPKAPLQGVASVKYIDSTTTENTMSDTDYIVDTRNEPGKIVLGYGKSWPSFTPAPVNAVIIRYICGYGGVSSIIPKTFIHAMLVHVGYMYKYRDVEIPKADMDSVNRIYYPDRIFTL